MMGNLGRAALFAAVLAYPSGNPQPGGPLHMVTARFYRGTGGTQVDAFCDVPFQLLSRLGGAPGVARYTVSVTVRDSARATLATAQWSGTVKGEMLGVSGASTVEHFDFAAPAPGAYTVEIAVTDSASGRVVRSEAPVVAYNRSPLASDLVLTGAMRRPAPNDTVPAPGEIRKGAFFLTAATTPAITPRDPRLFYYVELYPGSSINASIVARVRAEDGRQIIATDPQRLEVPVAGGVATGGLDLAGLPPGHYELAVDFTYPDTSFTRVARFSMAGFRAPAGPIAASPFDAMTDQQLDSVYAPLVYLTSSNEQGLYGGLSTQGKRNFLRQFWSRRDAASGSAPGQSQAEYYDRVAEANRRFREGGAAEVPGWRTDRGRIFLRYGAPDKVINRPHNERPYEIWNYERGRKRVFLFVDETGLSNYALWYTDEIREPSRPDWAEALPPEARRDLGRNPF
jgi:GWxTD domain-containing protein